MLFTRTLYIAAPREKVWELLSDTDRMNREIGLPPVAYEFLPRRAGGADLRGTVRLGPLTLHYRERPYEWVRPEFYVERRLFEGGPVAEFRTRFSLHPEGEGTRIACETHLIPRSPALTPVLKSVGQKFMGDLEKTWQGFRDYLLGQIATPYPKHSTQIPVVKDRWERAVLALESAAEDAALARRLGTYVASAPPEDVTLIRPFVLADTWGAARNAVLETCLRATQKSVGLLELRWRVLCPSCRGSAPDNVARRLQDVQAQVHCPSCNIRFDAAFDQFVEVCFAVAPAIRPVMEVLFCRGGPGMTPHVAVQWALEPGETRQVSLALPPGRYLLLSPQATGSLEVQVTDKSSEAGTETQVVVKANGAQTTLTLSASCLTPQSAWILQNEFAESVVLRLESPEPTWPVASAAFVTSLQAFRDYCPSEVLSPGTELAVRQVCILFSDLKGSTVMYRERGDAHSYRAVRDHFIAMRRLIVRHEGGIVKTIGDAVMAVFSDPAQALKAALAIQHEAQTWPDRLTVKLGLHAGPAIAVNANEMLDYFGQTVNLAARLQNESVGDDIVLAEELLADSTIQNLLRAQGCGIETFTRPVRGLDTPLAMARLTLPSPAPEFPPQGKGLAG